MVEVEQAGEAAGAAVEGAAAHAAEAPVVLDEPDHGRLVGQRVIYRVLASPGRDHQQWQARAEAASGLLAAGDDGRVGAALARAAAGVQGGLRLVDDRAHLM